MVKRSWSLALGAVFSAGLLCGAPNLARVPLSFEPGVRNSEFVAHAGGLSVVLTPAGTFIGQGRMRLIGARGSAHAQPEELLAGYSNYLVDRDPRKWRTGVPGAR
jgi:hypothetical protein